MPARLPSGVDDSWTDDLTVCNSSGVGYSTNIVYRHNGQPTHEHEFEDTWLRFKHDESTWLYGVLDGHDGKAVAEYAIQKLPAELLFGQLEGKQTDEEIKEVLKQAIAAVENDYFNSIGDLLARRTNLLMTIPEHLNTYETTQKYPDEVKELQNLNQRVASGASAIVALICSDKLYIANVGNCRALLCKTDASGHLRVIQLNVSHDIDNADEVIRLTELGLSVDSVRHFNHPTRCLGDFPRKGGYKDIDFMKDAKTEPVMAGAEMFGKIQLDESCQFLILMSPGVYTALQDATGVPQVNPEIAALVAKEFRQQTTLNGVAQAVVDELGRRHHDAFFTDRGLLCQQRDDMTLLIRNFNQPLAQQQNVNSPSLYASNYAQNTFGSETLKDHENTFIGATGQSTNSTNWSDDDSPPQQSAYQLRLDADGRVEPYVDFSEFYDALRSRQKQNAEDIIDDAQANSDMSESLSSVDD